MRNVTDTEWLDAANEFFNRRHGLSDQLKIDAGTRQQMGLAYVWGRQDAIGVHDSKEALAFSYDYALHAIDFYTERTFLMRNVKDAYERWEKGEDMTIDRDKNEVQA